MLEGERTSGACAAPETLHQGPPSTIRHCRADAGASAGTCALCLIGPSPACIRHRRRRDTAPWTHPGDAWKQDEQTNCACSLKDARRVSGQKKSRSADRKMNSFIFRLASWLFFARKLAWRVSSYRRMPFVFFFKLVRRNGSRVRCTLAQVSGPRRP